MSKRWKKYFQKMPEKITSKLGSLDTSNIVVSCVKSISVDDIKNGFYKHLNILLSTNEISYDELVIPSPYVGRFSKTNFYGKTISLKKLPKVNKTYSVDSPNFGDWSKGSHTTTWDKKVYQKKYILPREIYLNISLLEHNDTDYIFKFSLDTFLSKVQTNFMDELLFHCNLLQENIGLCDVFQADTKDEDYIKSLYVGWELLPSGTKDSDILNRIFSKIKHPSKELLTTITDRIIFFKSLDIETFIHGENRFNEYFGAIFNNGYALFENVRYGNAIYIFKDNWEELSKKSRVQLQQNKDNTVVRIPHTNNWKNNVKQALKAF